jgi:hypothetical protein
METIRRIGTFCILVGLALLILFLGSIISKEVQPAYLLFSMVAFVLGYFFRRNKPASDSERFRMLRRATDRNRKLREERMNRKKKK